MKLRPISTLSINRLGLPFVQLALLFWSVSTLAQKPRHHYLQITSDNDSYTLTGRDGYYTNGLKLLYGWNSNKDSANNTIHSIEIGQLMYNAKNGSYRHLFELDRPVTAFLYASYKEAHFNTRKDLLSWAVTLGTIGPPALGRELQKTIHSLFNMYQPEEWNYQLKTEIGLNADFRYSPSIQLSKNPYSRLKLLPVFKASLGNTFTGASLGPVLTLGHMNSNDQTIFWNSHLNGDQKESFFYVHPELVLGIYDATVQGGLFRKDKGPYTSKLNHIRYRQSVGWMSSGDLFSLGLALVYEQRVAKTQIRNQWYGKIKLGFSF